ncbi:MAG: peptidoglycan-associated lipoprotein, partial [Pseudomonadota bacterium]|nr:peptidoglycan-associated lipoprotein [Pseudomonadota bacterium]
MRMKILSMAAALLLVAACASEEKEVATSSGSGASQQNSASPSASSGASVSAPAPGSVEEFITIGDRVYFDFDKAEIRNDGTPTLNDQAAWLKKYPNITIVVEGHADERG